MNLQHQNPERTVSNTMNKDANAAAGQTASRSLLQSCWSSRESRRDFAFRAETQHGAAADPTVPPLPEEEGEGAAEPEDPSTELLRKVLAGSREPDISRVKLAKTTPPAKAWQDKFTIKLRTRANVVSPEFEAELVKKVFGSAGGSVAARHRGQTTCARDLFKQRRQDVAIPARRGSVVSLRDPESVTQRNPCQHGGAHGSTSREVFQACPLPRQDEAVVDVETVTHRPQGVAGGGKLAIQRSGDAIPEDGHGRHQNLNNVHKIEDLLAPSDSKKLYSAIERKAAGWAVMDADTRLSDGSAGAG